MSAERTGKGGDCSTLQEELLGDRALVIVSNRGPVTLQTAEDGSLQYQRGGGGLVTALLGLAHQVDSTWIAAANSDTDRSWKEGEVPFENNPQRMMRVCFVTPEASSYDAYYNQIANPLLWFLQHSIWNFAYAPTFTRETWDAWNHGYVEINRLFAEAIVKQIHAHRKPSLVMLQDYHLYLAPRIIRLRMRNKKNFTLTHFIHIPWPGPEDWGMLPPPIREAILDGLCAVDLLGLQTSSDALNFIRTCETLLPGAHVNYRKGRVWYHGHATHVRDFPISIDVDLLRKMASSDEVAQYRAQLADQINGLELILRIDRTEPSKNIVRGFLAYDEMLERYPEHRGKVQFLALLVPSRLEVEEYQSYLDELMAAAGRVNARHGNGDWEPVRVLVGESYPRAVAALQLYDVLLVNPVADGMNLIAKEGPMVNRRAGVLVLSDRAGAHQQLGEDALVVSPMDVYATAEALHRGLLMERGERRRRAERLQECIEREDIGAWLCWQLEALRRIQQ